MSFILNHPFLLFAASFGLMWLAAFAGMAVRSRVRARSADGGSDYGVVVGATLTLLGLLIGFTFSMAMTRYDQRKGLEEEEANAIGTEFSRVDFFPEQTTSQLQGLLRQYTDLRIRFYTTRDAAELGKIGEDTVGLQKQMWSIVAGAAKQQNSPLSAIASVGMNDVLNSEGYTQAAWRNRIPIASWSLLFLIALMANGLIGYGAHGRTIWLAAVLPLAVSVSFFLIADIDSPRAGIIRIEPQNLYALLPSLNSK